MPPPSGLGGVNRTAVLGFGNRLWRDDGAGSVLAERLLTAQPGAAVFDGGMVPENYLEKVANYNPGTVLLVDAADFGGEPGEVKSFQGDELAEAGFSTHAGSPRLLAAYLAARCGADVVMLAIQPADVRAGDALSTPVGKAVDELVELIAACD